MSKKQFNPLWLISVAVVSLLFCSMAQSREYKPGELDSIEKQCRFMLRTLGAAQHSYAERGASGHFGYWWHLQHSGYISQNYNRSNYIEHYSIAHIQAMPELKCEGKIQVEHDFTIIAVPDNPRSGLRTFATGADRKVYVWVGDRHSWRWNDIHLHNPYQWMPVGKEHDRVAQWEQRCILTLRALGSSQLAYADMESPDGNYGTYTALIKSGYIQQGYSRLNIIDNYSIAMFHATAASPGIRDSTFTIVAVPRTRINRLRTFAIDHKQTPKVWIAAHHGRLDWQLRNYAVNLNNPNDWQPIR